MSRRTIHAKVNDPIEISYKTQLSRIGRELRAKISSGERNYGWLVQNFEQRLSNKFSHRGSSWNWRRGKNDTGKKNLSDGNQKEVLDFWETFWGELLVDKCGKRRADH